MDVERRGRSFETIDSIEAHTELGNAYRGLKQYDKAIETYRAAKRIDRYRPAPHVENARALVEMGQIEQAIEQRASKMRRSSPPRRRRRWTD